MQRHTRLSAIFEYISTHEAATVEQLSAHVAVSPATIRRDLDHLAEQQLIVRTHGGATSAPTSSDLPMRYKTSAGKAKEKRRIAKAAAALAQPGEIIGLNGGTTTTEVSRELVLRNDLQEDPDTPITILTNAVNIAAELAVRPHLRVVLTGGVVRTNSFELVGPLSMAVLNSLEVDTLFLGVEAINKAGAFTVHDGEAAIDAILVKQALKVIVVADHTKLGARAFAKICELPQITTLVTDTDADPEQCEMLRTAGINVILV